ncbi:MAG: hypothetical protein K9K84_05130 [Methylovulum sp.]|jgi:hypothetical protein|nr:hypothetical protein [Methylovulum sp.]
MADSKETLRAKFLQTGGELLIGTNKNGANYSSLTQSDEFVVISPKIKPGNSVVNIVGDAVDDVVNAVFPNNILEKQQQKIKNNALEKEKKEILKEYRNKIIAELEVEKQKMLNEYRNKITAELELEKQKILDEHHYKIAAEQRHMEEKQKAEALKKQQYAKKSSGIVKFFKVIGQIIKVIAILFGLLMVSAILLNKH